MNRWPYCVGIRITEVIGEFDFLSCAPLACTRYVSFSIAMTQTRGGPQLIDDCFRQDPRDQARLSHADAVRTLMAAVRPVAGVEDIPVWQAAGRTCAETVTASYPIPGHTNAAVDGYAFAFGDYAGSVGPAEFPVIGRAAAGLPYAGATEQGASVRIFTGAVVPDGLDTVVMQEDCLVAPEAHGSVDDLGRVIVPSGLKSGANVRRAGEDVSVGDILVRPGQRLRPQDIGALASSGRGEIACFKPVRVGIASTGDEIVPAGGGRTLEKGQVFDVNGPMLRALVGQTGGEVLDLGLWPDKRAAVEARLKVATSHCDVIVTSGGASQGEEDHIAHALADIGSRHFWQIAVKPGRPLMLGQVDDTVVVGLPGNPVAVFVCYLLYVLPLIRRLGGADWFEPRRFPLPATFEVKNRKLGRREFWRGTTVRTASGLAVEKFPRDGSGLITGLRTADGLIDVPEDRVSVAPGELVDFIPFSEFGII
jgi:molybdopterin molybdotransferase